MKAIDAVCRLLDEYDVEHLRNGEDVYWISADGRMLHVRGTGDGGLTMDGLDLEQLFKIMFGERMREIEEARA